MGMESPHKLFFPLGAVLRVGEEVRPVLDPECRCQGPKCCLRAETPLCWKSFITKARQAVTHDPSYTAKDRFRTLQVVTEMDCVCLGQFLRDNKGKVLWQDLHTM